MHVSCQRSAVRAHAPRAFNSAVQPCSSSCTSSGPTSVRAQASVHWGLAGSVFATPFCFVCFLELLASLRNIRKKDGIVVGDDEEEGDRLSRDGESRGERCYSRRSRSRMSLQGNYFSKTRRDEKQLLVSIDEESARSRGDVNFASGSQLTGDVGGGGGGVFVCNDRENDVSINGRTKPGPRIDALEPSISDQSAVPCRLGGKKKELRIV